MYRNWGYLFVWREESANNRYVVGYLLGYPSTEDACSNIYFECMVGDVLFKLNSTRGRNVPTNIIMGEGGDLDNQQEFWVNKTHIAKIAAKAKNWLESKY
jgi:hypothetical protein